MCVQDDDGEVDKLPDDTFLRVIESTLLSDLSLKGIPGIKKVNISFFLCLLSVFSFFVFFSLLHFFFIFFEGVVLLPVVELCEVWFDRVL